MPKKKTARCIVKQMHEHNHLKCIEIMGMEMFNNTLYVNVSWVISQRNWYQIADRTEWTNKHTQRYDREAQAIMDKVYDILKIE
jgi:hypothetical protein